MKKVTLLACTFFVAFCSSAGDSINLLDRKWDFGSHKKIFSEYILKPEGFEYAGIEQVYLFKYEIKSEKRGMRPHVTFLGCGAVFNTLADGKHEVLTALHLIQEAENATIMVLRAFDAGKKRYYFDSVNSYHESIDMVSITIGKSSMQVPKLKKGKPVKLARFVHIEPKLKLPDGTAVQYLTSINSGKSYKVLGRIKDVSVITKQHVNFMILHKKSIGGESGSVFISESGHLFMLIGKNTPYDMSPRKKNMTMRAVEITHPEEKFDGSYSVLVGPFIVPGMEIKKPDRQTVTVQATAE